MVYQTDLHSKMKWFWCPFNRTLSIISIFCAPGLWLSSSRWRLFAIATSLLYVPSKLRRGDSEWLSAVFPHMATYPCSPSTLYISFLLSFLCINIITKFFYKSQIFSFIKNIVLFYQNSILFLFRNWPENIQESQNGFLQT